MSNNFNLDQMFSHHKDKMLKPYWGEESYEGRYILTGSQLLQKINGIDVILQDKKDITEIKVDTKHVRGNYDKFYLEEMSCTVKDREKLGWILKEDGWPDWVLYCFWPHCQKCQEWGRNCEICDGLLYCISYWIRFIPLREWFLLYRENYRLHINRTINKTSGRLVPIIDLINMLGSYNIREGFSKYFHSMETVPNEHTTSQ